MDLGDSFQAVCTVGHELSQEWWEQFLRLELGADWFRQALSQMESAEQVVLELRAETFREGKPIPEPIALMLVMRAAIETLALSVALERKTKCQK
jgi:hypothetical protein